MSYTNVIILIEGGVVQKVVASAPIKYCVVDKDSQSLDSVIISPVNNPYDLGEKDFGLKLLNDKQVNEQAETENHPWK